MLTLTPNPEVSPLSKEEEVSDKEVLDIIFKYAYCIDKIDKDWEIQYKFRTPNEDVKILEFVENYANMKSGIKELEAENERLKAIPYSENVAKSLIGIRNALIAKDEAEAYLHLYKIASPNIDKMCDDVWKEMENIANK